KDRGPSTPLTLPLLPQLPVLLRGTADDDAPCPGYLFEEIARISHESAGSSRCLLEFLLGRLRSGSCRVKLKVLKLLLHTCAQGSPHFLLQLKSNACCIRDAAAFAGPPDPLHGNSLNQKVRVAAQVSAGAAPAVPRAPHGAAGQLCMGSSPNPCGSLQGFGYSTERSSARHQPGLAGGGWEEADSGHSSQDSSQGIGERSRTSDSCSKSGSDSHSGAGRELSHAAERVDADSPGDCVREVSLVAALTRGARVFLTREEAQHFIKECGLLNCEVVLELLSRALEDPSDSVRMRSMGALSSLMCSDLLSLDQIVAGTRQPLQQLSQGSPGPVTNRATKILRQFEALCRGHPSPEGTCLDPDPSSLPPGSAACPEDLLLDIPPLPGRSILTPLSAGPLPGGCSQEPGLEAESRGQPSAMVPAAPGLFAGMELVPPPGAGAVLCPGSPPTEPQVMAQPRMDTEGEQQPSAFAFLNV
uniref:TEPSIN adaptor related protein complex 4 accessory protein n=1 Tax=Amazona collaria TaxID=241587 RepID=A0A8B9G1Q5_9PSIT